jgi:hypothetical protein
MILTDLHSVSVGLMLGVIIGLIGQSSFIAFLSTSQPVFAQALGSS